MILISAPAGFGKSALIEQWAADCGMKVSWLSLDASDNDPTRFWSYVIAALEKVQTDLGKNARALLVTLGQSLQPFPNELLITTLLNEIMASSDEAVLILDDYHLIENPGIHEGMIYLVDHLPPSMHIIISSRMDPPFPLARWRARSEMIELRADDLRFTFEET
jgi:LuxR family maltose regulon positive regulatory protein